MGLQIPKHIIEHEILGVLDSGSADSTYLRLDATNDPLTGDMETLEAIKLAPMYSYIATGSPFKRNSINFFVDSQDEPGPIWAISTSGSFAGYGFSDFNFFTNDGINANQTINHLDETVGDLNVFLCDAGGDGGGTYITLVTDVDFATAKAALDVAFGVDLFNMSGTEGIGAYSLSGTTYTFTMPSGWSVADDTTFGTTWTTPPTLTAALGYSTILYEDGTSIFGGDMEISGGIEMAGDLRNPFGTTDNLWWTGQVNIGSLETNPNLTQYQMNVQATLNNQSGIAVGLGFIAFGQATQATNTASYYGLFGGVFTNADQSPGANFTGNIAPLNATAFIQTSGTVSNVSTLITGIGLFTNGANVTSYKGFDFVLYDGSGGGSGTIDSAKIYPVPTGAGISGWSIDTFYGYICPDNSSYFTTSWGIYNEDRTYLWNAIVKKIETKTSDYTMTNFDYAIVADGTSNTVTIDLPPSPETGQVHNIVCIDSTNAVDIDPNGKNFYGSASNITIVAGENIKFQYDGTQWVGG